ncbi:MAG: SMC-Scp complex subunit ScpB [Kiritimatiellae bacterium]|nr:SMC-Scp complex subunit ScpB [Kiritimatiellia bacterium]
MNTNALTPDRQLTLKKIIGAMLLAARKPAAAADLKKIFTQTAEEENDQACRQFAGIKESEICAALEQIKIDLIQSACGIHLAEVAGGFRLQTDPECGPWLRRLLNAGRPSRLSKPALETLAIIAYRQPVTRAEIESVRGVNIDNIVRHLLECQLIKIAGRSKLPGHPMLYGTTQLFLEHFGLQSISHLPGIEQLRRREDEKIRADRRKAGREKPIGEDFEEENKDDEKDKDSGNESEQPGHPPPLPTEQTQAETENQTGANIPKQSNEN